MRFQVINFLFNLTIFLIVAYLKKIKTKPNFPSRGSDTIDTQDEVICNEKINYVKTQNLLNYSNQG